MEKLENSVWEITSNDTVMHLTLLDGGSTAGDLIRLKKRTN